MIEVFQADMVEEMAFYRLRLDKPVHCIPSPFKDPLADGPDLYCCFKGQGLTECQGLLCTKTGLGGLAPYLDGMKTDLQGTWPDQSLCQG
jgi:hypothetical protein